MSGPADWLPSRRGRQLTRGDLERAAAISVELVEKAKAAMGRLASIPEDDPDDTPSIN